MATALRFIPSKLFYSTPSVLAAVGLTWYMLHQRRGAGCETTRANRLSERRHVTTFDYCSPAELFVGKRRSGLRQRLGYRRFATAAEAIRFAVEDFPAMRALGTWMQVGDERYNCDDIYHLYESGDYPLRRRAP